MAQFFQYSPVWCQFLVFFSIFNNNVNFWCEIAENLAFPMKFCFFTVLETLKISLWFSKGPPLQDSQFIRISFLEAQFFLNVLKKACTRCMGVPYGVLQGVFGCQYPSGTPGPLQLCSITFNYHRGTIWKSKKSHSNPEGKKLEGLRSAICLDWHSARRKPRQR